MRCERRFVMVIEIAPLLLDDDEGHHVNNERRRDEKKAFWFQSSPVWLQSCSCPGKFGSTQQPRIDIPAITCILFWRGVIGESASFPTYISKKRYIRRASHRRFVCWIELVKLSIFLLCGTTRRQQQHRIFTSACVVVSIKAHLNSNFEKRNKVKGTERVVYTHTCFYLLSSSSSKSNSIRTRFL